MCLAHTLEAANLCFALGVTLYSGGNLQQHSAQLLFSRQSHLAPKKPIMACNPIRTRGPMGPRPVSSHSGFYINLPLLGKIVRLIKYRRGRNIPSLLRFHTLEDCTRRPTTMAMVLSAYNLCSKWNSQQTSRLYNAQYVANASVATHKRIGCHSGMANVFRMRN